MKSFIIEGIGMLAVIVNIIAWNSKARKTILHLQSLSSSFFVVHFFLLGGYSGAVMSTVTVLRNIVFEKIDGLTLKIKTKIVLLFVGISLVPIFYFWQGWVSLLPVCGVIVGVYAVSKENPKEMRVLMLATILFWGPYTILIQSFSGMLAQLISAIGISIGILRHNRKDGV